MGDLTNRKKKTATAKCRPKIKAKYLAMLMVTSLVTRVITQTPPPNLLAGLIMRKFVGSGVSSFDGKGDELDGDLGSEIRIESSKSLA